MERTRIGGLHLTMATEKPDEIVTLYHCRGCEMASMAGDVVPSGHVSDGSGDQLQCGRCGTRLNADSFFDYVDVRVVDYE